MSQVPEEDIVDDSFVINKIKIPAIRDKAGNLKIDSQVINKKLKKKFPSVNFKAPTDITTPTPAIWNKLKDHKKAGDITGDLEQTKDENETLKKALTAFAELRETYNPKQLSELPVGKISRPTTNTYLAAAAVFGIIDPTTWKRTRAESTAQKEFREKHFQDVDALEKKLETGEITKTEYNKQKKAAFAGDETIQKFIARKGTDKAKTIKLMNALKVMGLNTDDDRQRFLDGGAKDPFVVDKLQLLKRFTEQPVRKHPLSDIVSVNVPNYKQKFDNTPLGIAEKNFQKDRLEKKMGVFPKISQEKYDEYAENGVPKRVFVGQDGSKNPDRNNAIMYSNVQQIRNWRNENDRAVGDFDDPTELWSVSNIGFIGKYAQQKLKSDQLQAFVKCLEDGVKKSPKTFETMEYRKPTYDKKTLEVDDSKAGINKIDYTLPKDVPAKEFWEDAYHVFLIALCTGARQLEAITLLGNEIAPDEEEIKLVGKSGIQIINSKVTYKVGDKIKSVNEENFIVHLYHRKAEKTAAGKIATVRISKGTPQNPNIYGIKLIDFIKMRMKQIKTGEKTIHLIDGKKVTNHVLVGEDDRYVKILTVDEPAKNVSKQGKNLDALMYIFKHCYMKAGIKQDIFYERAVHSLRHIFAQYWLPLSNWNYDWVAGLGHWDTGDVLKKNYGKRPAKTAWLFHDEAAARSLDDIEAEQSTITGEQAKLAMQLAPDEEEEDDDDDVDDDDGDNEE